VTGTSSYAEEQKVFPQVKERREGNLVVGFLYAS
jgi:hypothetical protein